jgi:hypothetical protein
MFESSNPSYAGLFIGNVEYGYKKNVKNQIWLSASSDTGHNLNHSIMHTNFKCFKITVSGNIQFISLLPLKIKGYYATLFQHYTI